MPRPRRGTEEVFYDTFADWTAADQASALKVLEALHRQKVREERRSPVAEGIIVTPLFEGGKEDPFEGRVTTSYDRPISGGPDDGPR